MRVLVGSFFKDYKMKIKLRFLMLLIIVLFTYVVKAQTYTPNVSKDSLAVLNTRLDILKASIKLQELKIKESEEETDVEKLRIKLLEANGNAKESMLKSSNMSEQLKAGTQDAKAMEKVAKKAKNDASDAIKALDRFNKQIEKIESLRIEIKAEERKLSYKKPIILYNYN